MLLLCVRSIDPAVIAVDKLTVWAAVGELKLTDAPMAFGTPVGVQLPVIFQLLLLPDVPLVKLKTAALVTDDMAKAASTGNHLKARKCIKANELRHRGFGTTSRGRSRQSLRATYSRDTQGVFSSDFFIIPPLNRGVGGAS